MRPLLIAVTFAAIVALNAGAPSPTWAQAGSEGTPQVEPGSETLSYVEAATPQLLTHYWIVLYELDALPPSPSPDQVKASALRKRVLDLRLIMDFNAFAFSPNTFAAYRDALDAVYEDVGQYKDLFDAQAIGGPVPPSAIQEGRLARMNLALAPLRLPSFREDIKTFFYQRSGSPLALEPNKRPRLWQIAETGPDEGLDSVGNAALLGKTVLQNLRRDGLLIGDVFDPAQEAHFHDVRKALRSVEVLADMFPSLTAAVGDARAPLDEVVSLYGKANDQFVAYKETQLIGGDLNARSDGLSAAFARAQDRARLFVDSGQLDAYAQRLDGVQQVHRR